MCELWPRIPTTRCPFTHPACYSYAGITSDHFFISTFSYPYMHIWLRHYWCSLTISSAQLWMLNKTHHFSPFPLFHGPSPEAVQSCNNCSAHKSSSNAPSQNKLLTQATEHSGLQGTETELFWYFIYESAVVMHLTLSNVSAQCFKKRKPFQK